jgi:predicted amidohydrolase YtcJ
MQPVDTVVLTGHVLTLDAAASVAEGVAITGNRIAAVGTADEMRALVGPRTRVIERPGGTLIPGFNDAHAHMEREGLKHSRPSLAHCRSIAEVLATLRDLATRTPKGEWLVTMPLGAPPFFFDGPGTLAEQRPPDRVELDSVTTDHPVCIPGLFGNWGAPPGYTCLNSAALAANGITGDTRPRAPGIEILKDAAGEPTGVIVERNARPMVEFDLLQAVPRFGFGERLEGLARSMALYNAVGTTSVYEGHGSAAETIAVYRRLWEERRMTVRAALVVSPAWNDLVEAERAMRDWLGHARGSGLGDPWLRLSGVHVAFGGDPVCAALSRQDLPNTGWSGFVDQAHDANQFREICRLCLAHDLRLNTIVGDRLPEVAAILAELADGRSLKERRWVIQHIARTDQASLETLARLGILVTVIPVYYVWKGGHWYTLDQGENVMPMQAMLELGLDPAAATDNVPYQPGFTLWAMTERERRSDGAVLGPGQRLDRLAALRALTIAGARLTFEEHGKGPLAPGFLADLALLPFDPLIAEASALRDLDRALLTMVDGRIVHDAG